MRFLGRVHILVRYIIRGIYGSSLRGRLLTNDDSHTQCVLCLRASVLATSSTDINFPGALFRILRTLGILRNNTIQLVRLIFCCSAYCSVIRSSPIPFLCPVPHFNAGGALDPKEWGLDCLYDRCTFRAGLGQWDCYLCVIIWASCCFRGSKARLSGLLHDYVAQACMSDHHVGATAAN